MNFIRRLALILGTPALLITLVIAVTTLGINQAISNPSTIKRWLRESHIYNAVVPAIIEQSRRDPGGESAENNLNQPAVQAALQQAITPSFLEQSSEKVIDGTYGWLQGKTTKPQYAIDLNPVKTAFAANVAAAARTRLAGLPPCTLANRPTTTDPFELTCQPPVALSEPAIAELTQRITQDSSFLPQSQITPDTTTPPAANESTNMQPSLPATTAKDPWYQQMSQLPKIYQYAQVAPLVLAVLAILIAIGLLFASLTRRNGMQLLARITLTAGIVLSICAGLALVLFDRLSTKVASSPGVVQLHDPIIHLVRAFGTTVGTTQLQWGIGLIVLAVLALVGLRLTRADLPLTRRHDSPVTPHGLAPDSHLATDTTTHHSTDSPTKNRPKSL